MFNESAAYYDLVYDFVDYKSEAARLRDLIHERMPAARTLLDVGCGTGRHLEELRRTFDVEGLDASRGLLKVAERRCPDVPLHHARMEHFSIDRRFDVITCLFSAIAYTRTTEGMVSAIASMAKHLQLGGLLIIEPWFTPDRFYVGTITSNHASGAGLEVTQMYTSKRSENESVLDVHYLIGSPDRVRHIEEQQRLGLFSTEEQHDALRAEGLLVEYDPEGPFGRNRGLFIALRAEAKIAE